MTTFRSASGAELRVTEFGSGDIDLIWAHGWGQSHQSFMAVIQGLAGLGRHLVVDFPGFGGSPPPPAPWGTVDYAELVAEWIGQLPQGPRVWIGHSFGCRVGIRLASRHPTLVNGLLLIAAAGIRPPIPFWKKAQRSGRGILFRVLKGIALSEPARERLRSRWGSEDYRRAGALRATFVKVVNEDLTDDARRITLPVRLIYGESDSETPVTVGRIFAGLIPDSRLDVLPRYGHLDILTNGRFQLQALVKAFVQDIAK